MRLAHTLIAQIFTHRSDYVSVLLEANMTDSKSFGLSENHFDKMAHQGTAVAEGPVGQLENRIELTDL